MREYFVHRSLYHLKEADPYAFAIPRLIGQAKASFVAVEFDEYGAGRGERVHQQLFADLMAAAEVDNRYLAYLGNVPAETLAVVNLMSYFGLHRSMRRGDRPLRRNRDHLVSGIATPGRRTGEVGGAAAVHCVLPRARGSRRCPRAGGAHRCRR